MTLPGLADTPRSEMPEKPWFGSVVAGGSTLWNRSRYAVPTWRTRGGEDAPPGLNSHAFVSIWTTWTPPGGVGVGVGTAVGAGVGVAAKPEVSNCPDGLL